MSTRKPRAADRAARRGFLFGAGLAGAAGAAAVATRGAVAKEPAGQQKAKLDERGGGGYHVTDHVRRYYRSTLV